MSEHTPGPWEVIAPPAGLGQRFIRKRQSSGQYIAEIRPTHSDTPAEVDANARLIAAAPDLLAELQAAYRFVEAAPFEGALTRAERIREVIARATGEPS